MGGGWLVRLIAPVVAHTHTRIATGYSSGSALAMPPVSPRRDHTVRAGASGSPRGSASTLALGHPARDRAVQRGALDIPTLFEQWRGLLGIGRHGGGAADAHTRAQGGVCARSSGARPTCRPHAGAACGVASLVRYHNADTYTVRHPAYPASCCVHNCWLRGACIAGACVCTPPWSGIDCGVRTDTAGRAQRGGGAACGG